MVQKNETVEEAKSAEFFTKDGIFELEAFPLLKSVTNVINFKVNNNQIAAVTSKNKLFWFSANTPLDVTEIELSRQSDDLVHNIFLDPFGWHAIISMQSGTNYYMNQGIKKLRQMIKAKDILIDSVAWNQHNMNESTTQEILIGTNDGHVFETVLLGEENRFLSSSPEQYWKQLTSLGHSVTGLEIIRHPPGSPFVLVGEPQRCAVFATTPSRLYQFAGWINAGGGFPLLSHITSGGGSGSGPSPSVVATLSGTDVSSSDTNTTTTATANLFPTSIPALYYTIFHPDDKLPAGSKVTEFPKSFGYSDLKLFKPPAEELPNQFAWMTGSGIYFGRLNTEFLSLPPFTGNFQTSSPRQSTTEPSHQLSDQDHNHHHQAKDVFSGRGLNLARETKLIPYPIIRMLEHTSTPLGICLTAFHILVVYADRIKAANVLDDRTVYSMPVASELGNGRALGICQDQLTGCIWLFGHQGIARLKMKNELCRVWRIYLDLLQFDEARKFCQVESQLDTINIREAEHCFNKGDFMNSAKLFAITSVPFEEVALRFSQLSLRQTPMSGSFDVLVGKAVTSDGDILDCISSGVEDRTYTPFSNSSLRINSMMENAIDMFAPLKALVSGKLDQLTADEGQRARPNSGVLLGTVITTPAPMIRGQIILLTLWLAELLLNEIGFLEDRVNKHSSSVDRVNLQTIRYEFKELFKKKSVLANLPECKDLLYDLISSHGSDEEMVFVMDLMGDFLRLVDHYMRVGMYKEALNTFVHHPSSCSDRVYNHSMTLVLHFPGETVKMWLRLGKRLDVVKLLPSIVLLPSKDAMHYLQVIVDRFGCTDQAVHNLLASLCADASMMEREQNGLTDYKDPLLTYLESASLVASNLAGLPQEVQFNMNDLLLQQGVFNSPTATTTETGILSTNEADSIYFPVLENSVLHEELPYDPGLVLRKCKEVGHLRGIVFILKLLGMHHQALKTAIEWDDIPLAKEIARTESLSRDIRRQLWLTIARHVISKQSNMQEATNLLRECSLLKLEDIIPYFQDSVTIDQFKDAICASLDSYHQRVDEVKRDMHVTMQCTNALRKQLDGLRHRHEEFETDSRCTHCNQLLIIRPFYVFPCGHYFHTSCLLELVQPHLNTKQESELLNLIKGETVANRASSVDLHDKFDELIASDCVSCGKLAITNVSNLFVKSQTEYDAQMAIWF